MEKTAKHPPYLRAAGSRGVQGVERQLPGHTRPRSTAGTRGAPQHGRSHRNGAAERQDSGAFSPGRTKRRQTRRGRERNAAPGGTNRSHPRPPPCPTAFT